MLNWREKYGFPSAGTRPSPKPAKLEEEEDWKKKYGFGIEEAPEAEPAFKMEDTVETVKKTGEEPYTPKDSYVVKPLTPDQPADEGWVKDTWDKMRLIFTDMAHAWKQTVWSVVPNIAFRDIEIIEEHDKDYLVKTGPLARPISMPKSWVDSTNEVTSTLRGKYKEAYTRSEVQHQEWIKEHPELTPRMEWEGPTRELLKNNPELARDPAFWTYRIASGLTYTLSIMAVIKAATIMGGPGAGLTAGMYVMSPIAMQETFEELKANGATEQQASEMALPLGMIIASVEVLSDIFVIDKLSAPFKKKLMSNMVKGASKGLMSALLAGGKTFVTIEGIEVAEEEIQNSMLNAGVKTFNENRGLMDGWLDTAIETAVVTSPLALFGGGGKTITDIKDWRKQSGIKPDVEDIRTLPERTASSVLQIKNTETGETQYQVIDEAEFNEFKERVEGKREIKGKEYSLVSKTPTAMEKAGVEYAGVADVKEMPKIPIKKEAIPVEKGIIPQELEGIKRVNPELFRKATKAKTLEEFLTSMGKPEKVDYGVLTDFYNKVKLPTIPSELQPLAQEARKYKSAEELFHSTDKTIKNVVKAGEYSPQNYFGEGIYLGSKEGIYPGKNTYKIAIPEGLKTLDLTKGNNADLFLQKVSQKIGISIEKTGMGVYEDLRLMAEKSSDIKVRNTVNELTKGYEAIKSPLEYKGTYELIVRKPQLFTTDFYTQATKEVREAKPEEKRAKPKLKEKYIKPGVKVPDFAMFYTPNIEKDLTFRRAFKNIDSIQQAQLREFGHETNRQFGATVVKLGDAIGDWKDGAENTIYDFITGVDLETSRLIAAFKGRVGEQKQVLLFQFNPDGPHWIYEIDYEGKAEMAKDYFDESGIIFKTIFPKENKVFVVDESGELYGKIKEVSKRLGDERISVAKGTAHWEGDPKGESRAVARRNFEKTIKENFGKPSVRNLLNSVRGLPSEGFKGIVKGTPPPIVRVRETKARLPSQKEKVESRLSSKIDEYISRVEMKDAPFTSETLSVFPADSKHLGEVSSLFNENKASVISLYRDVKKALSSYLDVIGRLVPGKGVIVDLKTPESAVRKIVQKRDEGILGYGTRNLNDVLRSTIVVDSPAKARGLVEKLKKITSVKKVDDYFERATPDWGYTGINVDIELKGGMKAEVQIHTPKSLILRKPLHLLYKKYRAYVKKPGWLGRVISKLTGLSSAELRQQPTLKTTARFGKPSKVAKSIEAKAKEMGIVEQFEGLAEYSPVVIKEQMRKIEKLMAEDIEKAKRMATGKESLNKDVKGAMLVKMMEDYAMDNKDGDLILELANSPLVSETSEAGQTLRLIGERVKDSATAKIQEVKREREKVSEKRRRGKSKKQIKGDMKKGLKKEIDKKAKKAGKYSWLSLVDEIVC